MKKKLKKKVFVLQMLQYHRNNSTDLLPTFTIPTESRLLIKFLSIKDKRVQIMHSRISKSFRCSGLWTSTDILRGKKNPFYCPSQRWECLRFHNNFDMNDFRSRPLKCGEVGKLEGIRMYHGSWLQCKMASFYLL